VPLKSGRFDRTEVDMRWGELLVEAKLTESDFQIKAEAVVEAYRDFDAVFDRELLPRVELATRRRREATEFPEDYSQEFEDAGLDDGETVRAESPKMPVSARHSSAIIGASTAIDGEIAYAGYQLIRNVLAAHAHGCSFCVIHDERRPDLREAWFEVMAAVKSAEMRVRLKVLTWQELAALLPEGLQEFLDRKYGIVAPGRTISPVEDTAEFE
jgi:alkylhydroperoxidase family enzyme